MSKKDVISIEEKLKQAAAKTLANKQAESAAVPHISTKHGRLIYQDNEIPGSKLPCVVLSSVVEKSWYSTAYDPDNVTSPGCFSLAEDITGMVPHPNVEDPVSPQCKGCPKAEFGTAEVGKGPACKTRIRLVVMPIAGADAPEEVPKADIAMIKVPPTSAQNWTKYAKAVAGQGLPTWAVGTMIQNAPHDKKMFELTFKAEGGPLDKAVLPAIMERSEEALDAAMRPWSYDEE